MSKKKSNKNKKELSKKELTKYLYYLVAFLAFLYYSTSGFSYMEKLLPMLLLGLLIFTLLYLYKKGHIQTFLSESKKALKIK